MQSSTPIEYQVQAILEERSIPRANCLVTEYKVKWKGYPLAEASWEPIENLSNCPHILSSFQQRHKKKKTEKKAKVASDPKKEFKSTQKDKKVNKQSFIYEAPRHSSNEFYFEDTEEQLIKTQNNIQVTPIKQQPPPKAKKQLQLQIQPQMKKKQTKNDQKEQKNTSKRSKRNTQKQDEENKPKYQQIGKPYEQILERGVEEQLNTEPVKRRKTTKKGSIQRKTISIQTDAIPQIVTDMKILAMHYSYESPERIMFSVRQYGQLKQIARQTLLESYPRVLYSFYHQHYIKAKARMKELQREWIRKMQYEDQMMENEENQSSNAASFESEYDDCVYLNKNHSNKRIQLKEWKKQVGKRLNRNQQISRSLNSSLIDQSHQRFSRGQI